jgi:LacI family transcriptional regulator
MEKLRVTLEDVAELAQVSKMSVSRVLNHKPGVSEATRRRVTNAAERLGYEINPNPSARPSESKMIALLIPDITTAYMGEILRGVSNAAEQLDCGLVLYTQGLANHSERTSFYLSHLNPNMIDGVLLVVPRSYEAIVTDLQERNLPYAIIDHHNGTGSESSVTATNRKGMLDATRHLLALGHRRIGFITGRLDIVCSQDRLQGYRNGLAEVGIPFDAELIREGDFHQSSGFHNAQSLFQLADPPTAIIASNDLMAFGVMDAARAARLRIGHDLSIIGFDDLYLAVQTYPPLTTVRQPLAEMGAAALDMLLTQLQGYQSLVSHRELPTELIVRESTGRLASRETVSMFGA